MLKFRVIYQEGFARRAELTTPHGVIQTPAFMPVGTYGAVKTQSPDELKSLGTQILLGNTYHLFLRPGMEILQHFGGLHSFMNWDGPILTDSGGFQVFSLGNLRKVTEEGVTFQSPINGDTHFLTPELSHEIQKILGSDIAMVLDECIALPAPPKEIRRAADRSFDWAQRFLSIPSKKNQAIFLINQGGTELELRAYSLNQLLTLVADGIAVGGLSVGESVLERMKVLEFLAPRLPNEIPHYLMGVGTPRDLLEGIRQGIDLFDCVLPTRNARNGGFFTDEGLLNIRNARYRFDKESIDPLCKCECCQNYSKGYLRHLFQIKEILGCRLATHHNLYYYHRFMRDAQSHIEKGTFHRYYQEIYERLARAYPDKESEETCSVE